MHVVLVGGQSDSLSIYRGPLVRSFVEKGHRLTTVAGGPDPDTIRSLREWGADFRSIPLERAGLNLFQDLRALGALTNLLSELRPDSILAYQFKPIVLSLVAARLARVPRRFAMITGLGYAFVNDRGRWLPRAIATTAYRAVLPMAERVIFQNEDDLNEFVSSGLAHSERVIRVAGSGVDLSEFSQAPLPPGPPVFLMIARLLRDKGIYEFVEAARAMRRDVPDARFVLVGPRDPNPAAVSPDDLRAWEVEGVIEYRGAVTDVRPSIAESTAVVLPSYYREGVPRSLLEAMAMGRPIITTDMPGCRDAVVHGKNGLMVQPRDPLGLAIAMKALAADPEGAALMGARGRELAVSLFDATAVSNKIVEIVTGG